MSCVVLLDCLINNSKDADLLCDEDIVVHALSTPPLLCDGGIACNINDYYRSQWPRWRATLMRLETTMLKAFGHLKLYSKKK